MNSVLNRITFIVVPSRQLPPAPISCLNERNIEVPFD
jgi:hypothetical protein